MNTRKPSSNISDSVSFVLRGSYKRRSMAMAKAKSHQVEQGVAPRLVAVK